MKAALFLLASLLSQIAGLSIDLKKWESCNKWTSFAISQLEMTSDTSGDIIINIDGEIFKDLPQLSAVVRLYSVDDDGARTLVPCSKQGDCIYKDLCKSFPDLTCPNKKGSYQLEDYKLVLGKDGLPPMDYHMTVEMKEAQFCYNIDFTTEVETRFLISVEEVSKLDKKTQIIIAVVAAIVLLIILVLACVCCAIVFKVIITIAVLVAAVVVALIVAGVIVI